MPSFDCMLARYNSSLPGFDDRFSKMNLHKLIHGLGFSWVLVALREMES